MWGCPATLVPLGLCSPTACLSGSPTAPAELLGQRLGVAAFSPGWRSPATTLLHPWAGGPSERTVQTRESEHVRGGSRVFPNFCPVSALAPGKGFLTDVGNSSCRGSCQFSLGDRRRFPSGLPQSPRRPVFLSARVREPRRGKGTLTGTPGVRAWGMVHFVCTCALSAPPRVSLLRKGQWFSAPVVSRNFQTPARAGEVEEASHWSPQVEGHRPHPEVQEEVAAVNAFPPPKATCWKQQAWPWADEGPVLSAAVRARRLRGPRRGPQKTG